MNRRSSLWGLRGVGLILVAICAVALALASSPASAALTRSYTGVSFGPGGAAGSETFSGLRSVAVDQSTGDVFVYDAAAEKVYKFDSDGEPVDFSATGSNAIAGVGGGTGEGEYQVAVAPAGAPGGTAGDIYVARSGPSGTLKVFRASGEELPALTLGGGEVCGVAVNPAGRLFVGVFGSTIDEFTPSGNPPVGTDKTGSGTLAEFGLCNVAADGVGNVYATNFGGGEIAKLEGLGDDNPTLIRPGAPTIGVDPISNHLFADRGNLVAEYEAGGTQLATFGAGQLANSFGVAAYSAEDSVYVGDGSSGKVKIFGSPIVLPTVTAEAATGVTERQATLHGVVNPSGIAVTECSMEYGTSEQALDETVPCGGAIPTDEVDHPVTAALTDLAPATTYFFRLSATNANGTNSSKVLSFRTAEPVVTGPATAISDTEATLNGTVFPEGEAITECFFEYGETESYGQAKACSQSVPPDQGEHPVSATIIGLNPSGATYHFRLVVKLANSEEFKGTDRSFETAGAAIGGEKTVEVEATEAEVEAEINPRGSQTSYRFEYGTDTSYGFSTPEVALGEGEGFQAVTQAITGLVPATTYHWRVVAIDPFGDRVGVDRAFTTRSPAAAPQANCPNQVFRTGTPSAVLPDCRAYEQVSSTDKNGANIQPGTLLTQAAADGSAVSFGSPMGLPASTPSFNFIAKRSDGVWTTDSTQPALPVTTSFLTLGWDEEVDHPITVTEQNIYLRDSSTGGFEVIPQAQTAALESYFLDGFAGSTPQAIFETREKILPGAAPTEGSLEIGATNLYELDHGTVSLVGLVPATGALACGGSSGEPCEVSSKGVVSQSGETQLNPISRDGSNVFFTSFDDKQLYVREGGTATTRVSAPRGVAPDPNGTKPAEFVGATPSGSQVFFTSCEKLTADSTATSTAADSCSETEAGEPVQGQDLYRYDPASGSLQDLTTRLEGSNSLGAAVVGVLGASPDGSYVYFAANGVLAEGASPGDCPLLAQRAGTTCNIYLWHEGKVSLVARVFQGDEREGTEIGGAGVASNWRRGSLTPIGSLRTIYGPTARVADNGVLLLAASPDELDPAEPSTRIQLFRYQPGEGVPQCVSCDPSSVGARSDTQMSPTGHVFATSVEEEFLSRNLSADGSQVFFQTEDRLVAADTNGVSDVYEWEAPGSGSCTTGIEDGGCLYLLSSGERGAPAFFADSSASGRDVFFFTRERLVPADQDDLVDIYDARAEGGLPSQNTATSASCNSMQACREPGSQPASNPSPGTSQFQGPGNQRAKPCQKKTKKTQGKGRHCGKKPKSHHRKRHHRSGNHGKRGGGK